MTPPSHAGPGLRNIRAGRECMEFFYWRVGSIGRTLPPRAAHSAPQKYVRRNLHEI